MEIFLLVSLPNAYRNTEKVMGYYDNEATPAARAEQLNRTSYGMRFEVRTVTVES